jgi:hypothetical protein
MVARRVSLRRIRTHQVRSSASGWHFMTNAISQWIKQCTASLIRTSFDLGGERVQPFFQIRVSVAVSIAVGVIGQGQRSVR